MIEELKLIENRLIEIENKLLKRKSKALSNERNRLIAHRRELESQLTNSDFKTDFFGYTPEDDLLPNNLCRKVCRRDYTFCEGCWVRSLINDNGGKYENLRQ